MHKDEGAKSPGSTDKSIRQQLEGAGCPVRPPICNRRGKGRRAGGDLDSGPTVVRSKPAQKLKAKGKWWKEKRQQEVGEWKRRAHSGLTP